MPLDQTRSCPGREVGWAVGFVPPLDAVVELLDEAWGRRRDELGDGAKTPTIW